MNAGEDTEQSIEEVTEAHNFDLETVIGYIYEHVIIGQDAVQLSTLQLMYINNAMVKSVLTVW
jgi:hypothetical protein